MTTETVTTKGTYRILDIQRNQNGTYSTVENRTFDSGVVNDTVVKTTPLKRRKPVGWLYPLAWSFDKTRRRRLFGTMWSEIRKSDSFTGYLEFRDSRIGLQPSARDPVVTNPPVLPTSDLVRLRGMAEIKALGKLKNQRIHVGTAIAESNQLVRLVGSSATRIAKAGLALKHGKWKSAGRHLGIRIRDQPQNWLELQYGWKPLLSDIYGAAEALAYRNESHSWVTTVRALKEADDKVIDDIINPNLFDFFRRHVRYEQSVFVRLDYIPSQFSHQLRAPSALGLTNPLEVAWELVPFSFVVDWFSPVGNWLSTLDATWGYSFLSGSYTTRRRVTGAYSATSGRNTSSGRNRFCGGDCSAWIDRKEIRRVPYGSTPIPHLGLKSPLSLGHMANGLALLSQVFGDVKVRVR